MAKAQITEFYVHVYISLDGAETCAEFTASNYDDAMGLLMDDGYGLTIPASRTSQQFDYFQTLHTVIEKNGLEVRVTENSVINMEEDLAEYIREVA